MSESNSRIQILHTQRRTLTPDISDRERKDKTSGLVFRYAVFQANNNILIPLVKWTEEGGYSF